jgi:hypothetical protein
MDYTLTSKGEDNQEQRIIITTLYDLIDAINGEMEPGEDTMLVETVSHILNSNKVKFLGDRMDIR